MKKVEEWKPIDGYEGLYEVSSWGRVKRIKSVVWNRKGYWFTRQERNLKLCYDSDGYLIVGLCKEGAVKTRKVHQLVLIAFVGKCPEGFQTRHLNGDRADNRIENLAWGTAAEQMSDIEFHGNRRRGPSHHFYGRTGENHWLFGQKQGCVQKLVSIMDQH